MNQYLAELKNNRGAASVLVVLVMIVFITLGLLAMVFANSNYQLSQKTLAVEKEYYRLDAQAESVVADLDSLLIAAQREAANDRDVYRRLAAAALIQWAEANPDYSASYIEPALSSAVPQDDSEGYLQFTVGSEDSSLKVGLKPLLSASDQAERYQIVSWQKLAKEVEYESLEDIPID